MNRSLREIQKMKANMTTTCAARGVININYRVKRCDEVNKYTIILLLKKENDDDILLVVIIIHAMKVKLL